MAHDTTTTQETLQTKPEGSTEAPTTEVVEIEPLDIEALSQSADFDDWNLDANLRKALTGMGYEHPMPVQVAVFNILSAGHDLMVQSKTGSGKTAAFGIPIAQHLSNGDKGVQALILAPTRELALQVSKEIDQLVEHMDVSVVAVYGGAPIGPQISKLQAGAQIVAGTPGRVLDHIRRKTLDTSGIRMLILDECDEMLSMGFQEEIENIISYLPTKEERQTLLFSATIPKEIERIGRKYMRDPEMLSLSSDSVGAELIDHYYYVVTGMARTRDLLKLMKAERPDSAIIFCNTREETNSVARYLTRHGYDAEALSSDLSQSDRERVMGRMRAKNLNFLVATDIAARGIDISELSHVINFTFPSSPEIYVHRSGRTGRAGKQGTALSLVGPREIGAFYYLKLIYKIIPTERELPTADEMATIEEGEQYEKVVKMLDGKPRSEYLGLARRIWQSNEGERVFGLLLEELMTKASAPAKATVTTALAAQPAPSTSAPEPRLERAPRPKRTPRSEPEPRVAANDESVSEDASEERPRRKRRRRRSSEEQEDVAVELSPADHASEVAAQPSTTLAVEDNEANDASQASAKPAPVAAEASQASEPSSAATESPEALPQVSEPSSAAAEAPQASERSAAAAAVAESAEAPQASEPTSAAATEAEEEPLASQPAPVDALSEDESPRPRRKRRRRHAATVEHEDSNASSDESASESVTTNKATEEKPAERIEAASPSRSSKSTSKVSVAKTPPTKAAKRRARKPAADPGPHIEFWEAWAETKSSGETSAAAAATQAPKLDVKTSTSHETDASEENGAPQKRRRRVRKSRKSAAESESDPESASVSESEVKAEDEDNAKSEESSSDAESDTESDAADSVRLFVNVGKREDADADEIMAFLSEAIGDKADGLGRITLRNTHCYVRVQSEIADEVIEACTGLLFKEREMVVERARR